MSNQTPFGDRYPLGAKIVREVPEALAPPPSPSGLVNCTNLVPHRQIDRAVFLLGAVLLWQVLQKTGFHGSVSSG